MLKLTPRNLISQPEHFAPLTDRPSLQRVLAARLKSPNQASLKLAELEEAASLKGIDQAAMLISDHIDSGELMVICGDFDCDGATSTALMVKVLTQLGARVEYLIPDRFSFGYGLTPKLAEHAKCELNPSLLITVDNGISSHEGVARAHELGMKVVITDHHLTTKQPPDAEAVVNPNQPGCSFASKSLAGVGVAFYLLGRLCKLRAAQGHAKVQVTGHLDLVALGTVADLASLDSNNRKLVQAGLSQINSGKACFGIQALLQQAGKALPLHSKDLGFVLGPRLNAAGRMAHMSVGVECLLAADMNAASVAARQLEALNQKRREVESSVHAETERLIEKLSIETLSRAALVYDPSFHLGVVGIVASRLSRKHGVPSVVFAKDEQGLLKGSGRSIEGVHIRDTLEQIHQNHPGVIEHFGGHAMAAGLTLKPEHLGEFKDAFLKCMNRLDAQLFTPSVYTDGELDSADFELEFASQIQALGPWGQQFIEPVFDGVFEVLDFQVLKDKHLKLFLLHPSGLGVLEALWFNFDSAKWSDTAHQVHVLYELQINHFRGNSRLQLKVVDLCVSEPSQTD